MATAAGAGASNDAAIDQFYDILNNHEKTLEYKFGAICQRIKDSNPSSPGISKPGIAARVEDIVCKYVSKLPRDKKSIAVYTLLEALASKPQLLNGQPMFENRFGRVRGETEKCVPGQYNAPAVGLTTTSPYFSIQSSPKKEPHEPGHMPGDILVLAVHDYFYFTIDIDQTLSKEHLKTLGTPPTLQSLLHAAKTRQFVLQNVVYVEDTWRHDAEIGKLISELAHEFFSPTNAHDMIRAAFLDIARV